MPLRRLATATALVLALVPAAPAGAREALEDGHFPMLPLRSAFPVDGPVDYGPFGARFGGGRGHKGQDVFADCGSPVRAVRGGRVVESRFEGRAGNYLVVAADDRRHHVYMHLRSPARPAVGDLVVAGERLGSVGDTGVAWDCHLHFELWTAPGWYRGGEARDPLPYLRGLRSSAGPRRRAAGSR